MLAVQISTRSFNAGDPARSERIQDHAGVNEAHSKAIEELMAHLTEPVGAQDKRLAAKGAGSLIQLRAHQLAYQASVPGIG